MFTEHDGDDDYREFVRSVTDADCLDSPDRGDRDWRDVAVNFALDRSTAEWVWFGEQDFIIPPDWRWPDFTADAYGWQEHDDRWHPSCLFVRRRVIDRTRRYFGNVPVDHFYAFGREVAAQTPIEPLAPGFEHLQGTSQNHYLIEAGIEQGIFAPARFRRYLADCLAVSVPLHPEWVAHAKGALP